MLRYAVTIFFGAFLLFLVQPMIGKYILPWFGGGPGVWTTCMLFFQSLLLIGYAYAFAIDRALTPRGQMIAHLIVLLASAMFLPIVPHEIWKPSPQDEPAWRILLLLGATLGVPFAALAATSPLLQAWFTRTHPGVSPYRLFALSNVGSLLALVCYPFVLEPSTTRQMQALIWSMGFGMFALACAWCAVQAGMRRNRNEGKRIADSSVREDEMNTASEATASPKAGAGTRKLLWIALPAGASIMLLAVTGKMSEEISPVPFLWVLPLATYLITFIVAFEWPRAYARSVWIPAMLGALYLASCFTQATEAGIRIQVVVYTLVLFVMSIACHGELYRLRPAANRLTAYYLAIALGGALGGVFVAVIAPRLFTGLREYEIGLYGSFALIVLCLLRDPQSVFGRREWRAAWLGLVAAGLGSIYFFRDYIIEGDAVMLQRTRNFYGTLTATLHNPDMEEGRYLRLMHGRIIHGTKIVHPQLRLYPTTYYGPNTGIGRLFNTIATDRPRRAGFVGLGVGTLARYGRPGDVFRFYEINPEVERMAREIFDFTADTAATVEVLLGDARLTMDREAAQRYDVLVLDAFSGDAIPVHLLTMEAFEIYMKHLADDGVIAVHVTNRYVDLAPVLKAAARHFNLEGMIIRTEDDKANQVLAAHWVLLTRDRTLIDRPPINEGAVDLDQAREIERWTDDRASVLRILK